MPFPLYLAMTAAELAAAPPATQICYMACHFSPYGTGLSGLPTSLPGGSVLILNDRIPLRSHDPALVSRQLAQTAESLDIPAILLDLQQPYNPKTAEMVKTIVQTLSCPVAVSDLYAQDVTCDVFLSAPELHTPLEKALQLWQQRNIWLELATEPELLILTEEGCRPGICDAADIPEDSFFDKELCCHYRMRLQKNEARFLLWRTEEDWRQYLQKAAELGVCGAVGLYQQLWDMEL